MKLLFISDLYPTGLSGVSVRSRNLLNTLLKRGHKVDFCCPVFDNNEVNLLSHKNLKTFTFKSYHPTSFYSLGSRIFRFISFSPQKSFEMYDEKLQTKIYDLTKDQTYDLIFFDGFYSLQYQVPNTRKKIYIDDEDISLLFKYRSFLEPKLVAKFNLFVEHLKSHFYRQEHFVKLNEVWAISSENRRNYKKMFPELQILFMPTFIPKQKNIFNAKSKDIVFIGSLDWPENISGLTWFVKEIWPLVYKQNPRVSFHIVGQSASRELKRLLKSQRRVEFHGYVKSLASVYKRVALAVSPVKINVGIKLKVLDYLSFGLPVVSTPESVFGLPTHEGVVTANPKEFSGVINSLLMDVGKRKKLSVLASKTITKNHSQKKLISFLEKAGL